MAHVELHREGTISFLTLNRPERRNAITVEMMQYLVQASRSFLADEATRAVIFRAEGADFCVGVDLAASQETDVSMLMRRRRAEFGAELIRAVHEIPQPTICTMQGVATGGGTCIASACDFRIGGETARIGYGEVKLGMNLMWNAAAHCLRLVGPARAKRMIMTGQLFDTAILERWGFLDEVVPAQDLGAAARRMADEYSALPPNAVQMIKRSLNHLAGALDRSVMHMDADQWLLATLSDDHKEAVSAFFQKRTPTFTGN